MATLPETSTITVNGKVYNIKDADGRTMLATKQDKLVAGEGITIDENGVISANLGGIEELDSVPTANASTVGKIIKVGNHYYKGKENKFIKLYAWNCENSGTVYTNTPNPKVGDCFVKVTSMNNDYYSFDCNDTTERFVSVDNRVETVEDDGFTFGEYKFTRFEILDCRISDEFEGDYKVYRGTWKLWGTTYENCNICVPSNVKSNDFVFVKCNNTYYCATVVDVLEDSIVFKYSDNDDTTFQLDYEFSLGEVQTEYTFDMDIIDLPTFGFRIYIAGCDYVAFCIGENNANTHITNATIGNATSKLKYKDNENSYTVPCIYNAYDSENNRFVNFQEVQKYYKYGSTDEDKEKAVPMWKLYLMLNRHPYLYIDRNAIAFYNGETNEHDYVPVTKTNIHLYGMNSNMFN